MKTSKPVKVVIVEPRIYHRLGVLDSMAGIAPGQEWDSSGYCLDAPDRIPAGGMCRALWGIGWLAVEREPADM